MPCRTLVSDAILRIGEEEWKTDLGGVDVGEVEGCSGVAGVEDRRQADSRLKGPNPAGVSNCSCERKRVDEHNIVHFIVNDVPGYPVVHRVDHVVEA